MSLMGFIILPHYFKRRLGRATAIMNAGTCAGLMVTPPLVTLLQEIYSFRGATLLVAGFMFNCIAASAVFHPVQWHVKKSRPVITCKTSFSNSHNCHDTSNSMHKSNSSSKINFSLTGKVLLKISGTFISNSKRVLKSPRALILIVSRVLLIGVFMNFAMLVPFVMQTRGFSQEEASLAMSIASITNLLSRLLATSLTDWHRFNITACFLFGIGVSALFTVGKGMCSFRYTILFDSRVTMQLYFPGHVLPFWSLISIQKEF